ncbi:MAG: DUF551 domain-containing protein [Bacteroidales bacterium]|nr:DUF551 domain-containing protein [Bacteroidales bacterium]
MMNEWIDVNVRLPEESEDVLIVGRRLQGDPEARMQVGCLISKTPLIWHGCEGRDLSDEPFYEEVTHWMPLPERPGPMDPDVFAEKMQEIINTYDEDLKQSHIKMDELMCKLLIDLGYYKGIYIFQGSEKWYA